VVVVVGVTISWIYTEYLLAVEWAMLLLLHTLQNSVQKTKYFVLLG
jgi:hypothetical protein